MQSPLVSVIVPTRNSASTIEACLKSIKEQTYKNVEIIVVDQESADKTVSIAKEFNAVVISLPKSNFYTPPTESRNAGAKKSKGVILYHIDSDMSLSSDLIQEIVSKLNCDKVGALIIHEQDITKGYWSKAKALERKCYWNNDNIESARAVKRTIFEKVDGYDENISSGEDFDIHRRYKKITSINYCQNVVYHNLGGLSLFKLLKKKYSYGKTAGKYFKKHSESGPSIIEEQLKCFAQNYNLFLESPFIGIGAIVLKISEFAFGGLGYINLF